MNCVEVQTTLAEDLVSRTDEGIASHLSCCPECRTLCDELLELEDLSRSLSGRFRVPSEFRDQVLARLEDRRSRRRRGIAFAAVLFLLVAVALLMRPWESDSVPGQMAAHQAAEAHFAADAVRTQAGPDYVDVIVSQDGGDDLILRVPSLIEIHRAQPQEDFYINNVSH